MAVMRDELGFAIPDARTRERGTQIAVRRGHVAAEPVQRAPRGEANRDLLRWRKGAASPAEGRLCGRAPMRYPVKGKVVVVTGASAGVGRAAVRAFAARGADVALIARGQDGLDG